MVETSINLCGVTLDNPIIPASGTFGFGYGFMKYYDINILGTFSFKGTTREARYGNPLPRIAECTSGILNSVGLQNPGVDAVIKEELPRIKKCFKKPVMANICGFSVDEYVEVSEKLDKCEEVGFLEINVSCPNAHGGGMAFGTDPDNIYKVTKAVKDVTEKPVIIKLSPNVTDITEMAKAAEAAGADAVSLINTLLGMRIDIMRRKPIIANTYGGFSGPAVFPIALRMVNQVYKAVKIPVIGLGGVESAENVIEMMMAGATCVQVGTANMIDPYACKTIIDDLPQVMEKYRIEKLSDIIGVC